MDALNFLDDSAHSPQVHRTCRAKRLIEESSLSPEERAQAWFFVNDPEQRAASNRLSKYLIDHGVPVSIDAIRRHRRRECACPTDKDSA